MLLHYYSDNKWQRWNRYRATSKIRNQNRGIRLRANGLSIEEYPFASSIEGGYDAHVEVVSAAMNSMQGGLLSSFILTNGITDGDAFIVLVVP